MAYQTRERKSDYGRPQKYAPGTELTNILAARFPVDLHQRFENMCEEREISQIDFTHYLIQKEAKSKKVISKYPLDPKPGQTMRKFFRGIPHKDWVKFRIKGLYYGIQFPVNLLTQIIQEEVMAFEGRASEIRKYHQPIFIKDLGPLSFSPRVPYPVYKAMHIIASDKKEPVHIFISEMISKISKGDIDKLKPFPFDYKEDKYMEPRLVNIDRKAWIEFRSYCIKSGSTVQDILATFLFRYIIRTLKKGKKIEEQVRKEIEDAIKPCRHLVALL